MGRLRYERRNDCVQRTLNLIKCGVLYTKPPWLDAVRNFPPPSPAPYRMSAPPPLLYLEDKLWARFHQQYKDHFGEPYAGVNHMGKIRDSSRARNSYRHRFVSEQARLMRQYPELSEKQAFDLVVPALEKDRKADRNKTALMSRYMLDVKARGLDETLVELQKHGDQNVMARASEVVKRRISAEERLVRSYMTLTGLRTKVYIPEKDADYRYVYDDY